MDEDPWETIIRPKFHLWTERMKPECLLDKLYAKELITQQDHARLRVKSRQNSAEAVADLLIDTLSKKSPKKKIFNDFLAVVGSVESQRTLSDLIDAPVANDPIPSSAHAADEHDLPVPDVVPCKKSEPSLKVETKCYNTGESGHFSKTKLTYTGACEKENVENLLAIVRPAKRQAGLFTGVGNGLLSLMKLIMIHFMLYVIFQLILFIFDQHIFIGPYSGRR
eukprot:m.35916 g.35916  ORF g.35916 m.35916 type:complete len:223 (+) comp32188_c0_seq1:102-770(+)